jgi:hypothetical protein
VNKKLDSAIKWLIVVGFITLPYTHIKWVPDLGTTRPVCLFFFAAAFGLVMLKGGIGNWSNPKDFLQYMRGWDNWPILRWWVALLILGVLSAFATLFYGLPVQAFIRLLGYFAIFVSLFIGAYSLRNFGMSAIARFIMLGYLPVLIYAIIEALSIQGISWAWMVVSWVRNNLIVPFGYSGRLTLLATEPSFLAFQLVLLLLVLPFVTERWLRWCGWLLVAICLVYSKSATVLGLAIIYIILWGLFSLRRPALAWLTGITVGVMGAIMLVTWLVPASYDVSNSTAIVENLFKHTRLNGWIISGFIRLSYIMSLFYAILDSHGLGLGIGQYGLFWKDIYLRHINYQAFDIFGEVAGTLASPVYMKPWSAILGVGVDLGLVGLALLGGFFWQVYRSLARPRHRALFLTCLVALFSAYPIVTPHIWLSLALMAGLSPITGSLSKRKEIA